MIKRRERGNLRFGSLISTKKICLSKRSQEEMVGFVLIIVLVAVIVLVFLAISIRKTQTIQESGEIESFLHSSLSYTTDCKPSAERIYDLKDLITACYENEKCLDEKDSCDVLNNTLIGLIEKSFQIGEEAKYKAYELRIYVENDTILYLTKGNFSLSRFGGSVIIPISDEIVHLDMRLFVS